MGTRRVGCFTGDASSTMAQLPKSTYYQLVGEPSWAAQSTSRAVADLLVAHGL